MMDISIVDGDSSVPGLIEFDRRARRSGAPQSGNGVEELRQMAATSRDGPALFIMLAKLNRRRTLRLIHRTSDLPVIMPTARGRKCHITERLRQGYQRPFAIRGLFSTVVGSPHEG